MGEQRAALILLLILCFVVSSLPLVRAAEDFWTTKEPMPTARAILGAAVVDAKIYAIGGLSGGRLSTNEMYDPATDSWVTKTPMPTQRSSFGTAVVENKVYIIGGDSSDGVTGANEVYDPVTDTWETKTPMPTPRDGLDANVVNGKIYLISGLEKSDYPTYANVSALTEVYDPVTDSWTTKASIPNPVFFYASAVVDNKIYVIGGSSATVAQANFNQIYNADTDTWTSGKTPEFRVTEAGSGATTGVMAPKRIYVIGGRRGDRVESATQVYNPEDDSWTVGTSMPTSRFHLAIAVVNDKLYALGGYPYYKNIPPQIYLEENEQYTPIKFGTIEPIVEIVSPENRTYPSGNVPLVFMVNKPVVWMGYIIDGQRTMTIPGNITLSGPSGGVHNITILAKDEFNNIGTSETIIFSIAAEPFPTTLVLVASVVIVTLVGAALLIYFKKRKH